MEYAVPDHTSLLVTAGNEPPLPPATPQDTVTLSETGFPSASSQIPASQRFAQNPIFVGRAFVALMPPVFYPPENSGRSSEAETNSNIDSAVPPPQSPSNPLKRDDLLNATASSQNSNSTAYGAAKADEPNSAVAVQASGPIAQESLQQLDRTLQQIGINPQSISSDSPRAAVELC
jgi:hypothetical protein